MYGDSIWNKCAYDNLFEIDAAVFWSPLSCFQVFMAFILTINFYYVFKLVLCVYSCRQMYIHVDKWCTFSKKKYVR